jgi:hypothetical protein
VAAKFAAAARLLVASNDEMGSSALYVLTQPLSAARATLWARLTDVAGPDGGGEVVSGID